MQARVDLPIDVFRYWCANTVPQMPRDHLDEAMLALVPWWSMLPPALLAQSPPEECLCHLLEGFYWAYHIRRFYKQSIPSAMQRILRNGLCLCEN